MSGSDETIEAASELNRGASVMSGAFDAGDRFDRALELWTPADQSADQDTLPAKENIDARAKDLARNDAYIQGGITLHKDAIVGSRYVLNARPRYNALGRDDVWAREFSQEVEERFGLWAESMDNWPDAARRNTFTELIRLAVGVYVVSGEYLATVEWRSREEERPYYTAIQPVELNRLSTPQDRMGRQGENVRGGIRFSSSGRPLGYYIRHRERSFGGGMSVVDDYRWSYIRANAGRFGPLSRRPQVIHITEQHRPAQSRGISQLASAIKSIRMCQRFRDVVLANAAVNASIAATIESELPATTIYEQLGSNNVSEGAVKYANEFLSNVGAYTKNSQNIKIDGVRIPHLYPGTKLNLQAAGTPGGIGTEFEASFLRYTAASLGVSYEELSRDYGDLSYSTARATINQTQRHMRARKRFIADRLASTVYRLWLEEAYNAGDISTLRGLNIYDGMNMEAVTACEWLGSHLDPIESLKEASAIDLRLRSGLTTYEAELARQGLDWRQVFEQRAREREMMQELDIMPREQASLEEEAEAAAAGQDGNDSEGG